jgi:2-hydroxychromene-2-carboxylate isomerase
MAAPIDFFFDFSSPYGYLAAQSIDARAARHGRAVTWRPFLLGIVFKLTGSEPLLGMPMKGDYAAHDLRRAARRIGVPFMLPEPFPFMSVAASRAFYALTDQDPAAAKGLARALYHAAFGEGRNIAPAEAVIAVAEGLGLDGRRLGQALQDPDLKERLKSEVQAAIDAGVFGSPFFLVDGEPFWGHDRLGDLEKWLETGGW